ncbi:MAG: PAS domain S-box protein [Syntrophales bacterium]|nr:PAS domain S-box protein [Syntrophales bacterium]
MKDQSKTKQVLIQELDSLRQRIEELKQPESEWKKEKEGLTKSEARFRSCFDLPLHGIAITSPEKGWIQVNDRICSIMGYSQDEIVRMTWSEITHPDDLAADLEQFNRVLSGQIDHYNMDKRFIRKDGKVVWTNLSVGCVRRPDGSVDHTIAMVEDITSVKLAEEALRESEDRYRSLFDNTIDAVMLTTPDGRILAANPEACRIFGRTEEEICRIGRAGLMDLADPRLAAALSEQSRTGRFQGEFAFVRKDGVSFPGEISSIIFRDHDGNLKTSMIVRDISDRKRTEDALQESEERLRDLIFSIADWVWEVDENGVYTYSSQKGIDLLGESPEDILGKTPFDFMPPDEAQRVAAIFSEIVANKAPIKDLENWNIRRNGEKICLLTNGVPVLGKEGNLKGYRGVDKDITERKRVEKELAQSYDLLTNLARQVPGVVYQYRLYPDGRSAFPYSSPGMNDIYEVTPEDVRKDATPVFGRLHPDDYDHVVVSIQKSARTLQTFYCEFRVILPRQGLRWRWSQAHPERLVDGSTLWHGIISDITERKQIEEQLQQTLESLRKAFGATIQVMVSAVEARDPYTAGHQIRSADIARAIATEMGLSQDTIEAIRMAGPIHDIGKLSVPAEILSKPTKLSEIEFSLIKEHARTGYEMLKDVESPWPLAEIVYQHHERMDGSGYPRNLRGDEILIEARIIAVADVVESMASHRPYRPALGLNAALEEIESNKGTLYDADAVDTCLRLFREKGFQIERG